MDWLRILELLLAGGFAVLLRELFAARRKSRLVAIQEQAFYGSQQRQLILDLQASLKTMTAEAHNYHDHYLDCREEVADLTARVIILEAGAALRQGEGDADANADSVS